MKVTAEWQGVDRLMADLTNVSNGVKGQVIRAGLRSGAKVIRDAAVKDNPSRRVRKALTSVVFSKGAGASFARIGTKRKTAGNRIFHLIENDTRPHQVKPRQKRVLATNGKFFGKLVQHPGTRGRRQFERIPQAHLPEIERKTAAAMRAALDKIQLRILQKQAARAGK